MKMFTTLVAAGAMACIAGFAQAATTTTCPDGVPGEAREFVLSTPDPFSNACYAWGDNNDANDAAFKAQLLADYGSDYGLIGKVEYDDDGNLQTEGAYASLLNDMISLLGGTGGTFSIDLSGIQDAILVFKTGTGRVTPGFAAFTVDSGDLVYDPGEDAPRWSVNQQQGLSHVALYGTPMSAIPLPAAGVLMLAGLGGLGGLAMRRRKSRS